MAATNSIDGGVSTVSGRTAAIRSCILQDANFTQAFLHEYLRLPLFGWKVGPLNADDDKFLTRWVVSKGWGIRVQHCSEATIETELGEYPRYFSQCLRWARTSWRSNLRSLLLERIVWISQPWCLYAIYVTSLVNMALFYDGAMLWTLFLGVGNNGSATKVMTPTFAIAALICWIFTTKVIKLTPHFIRYPRDTVYFPCYVAFAYAHTVLKLYALLTAWDISWGGRPTLDTAQPTSHRHLTIDEKRRYETEIANGENEDSMLTMV